MDEALHPEHWDLGVHYVSLQLEGDVPTAQTMPGHPLETAIGRYNAQGYSAFRLLEIERFGGPCYAAQNLYDASAGCTHHNCVVVLQFDLDVGKRIIGVYNGNRELLKCYPYNP